MAVLALRLGRKRLWVGVTYGYENNRLEEELEAKRGRGSLAGCSRGSPPLAQALANYLEQVIS